MKQKWVSFTFSGNYVWTITKLLKNTNIKISFKTNNTIGNILKERITTNKYEQTGIYRLACAECKKYALDKLEEHSKLDIKNTFAA
jgi:hypothetical protein